MKTLSAAVIGHVDHGKTTLVRALTGKDTDRLAEEKARGISIVAGYALLRGPDCEIDLIDTPGHERFLRAMISGAGGVGAVLLAVAANEGVKPQTLEHLEVARLLGVRRAVVALTKSDLVDASGRRARLLELQNLAAAFDLGAARVIAVSALVGDGLREIASALIALAKAQTAGPDDGFAYLPIDRAFAAPGFGPVVTGTLRHGGIRVGDELELHPSGLRARVRSLQMHNRAATAAQPGRRVAVCLRGVELKDLGRGMSLATPGRLNTSEWLDVELRAALHSDKPLRDGASLRFLSGTFETDCRLRMLDGVEVAPGARAIAQIRCAAPVTMPARETFILRRITLPATVGGGLTLDPVSRRRRRGSPPLSLIAQASGDLAASVMERLREAAGAGETLHALMRFTALSESRLRDFLIKSGALRAGSARAFHPGVRADMLDQLRAAIDAHHLARPLESGLRLDAAHAAPFSHCIDELATALVERGEAVAQNGVLRRPDFKPGESESGDLARRIAERIRNDGLAPPDERTIAGADASQRDALRFLVELGVVIRARDRVQNRVILFHRDAISAAQRILADSFPAQTAFLAREAGAALGVSRKYSIPLLEHLDAIKFTQRSGDRRIVAAAPPDEHGGDWGLVAPLVFKTRGSSITSGGFDSHPPPPSNSTKRRESSKEETNRRPCRPAVRGTSGYGPSGRPATAFRRKP